MTLALLWVQLAVAAALILVAAVFMTKSADVIASKTGMGRAFAGVLLLATATSLPEMGVGVSSVALLGAPDMAIGAAFGSNLFNLMIIGLLDILWRNRYILSDVGRTSVVIGTLGIVAISLGTMAIFLHGTSNVFSTWYLSPVSIALLGVFGLAMYFIYRFDQANQPPDHGGEEEMYATHSVSVAAVTYLFTASVVVGSAVWLSFTGDELADRLGWDESYMGTQFLAAATSLPELATSISAIRIAAPEMAITNLLGSNLFNMGFVLFVNDAAHTSGTIWMAASQVHILTATLSVLMTTVVVLAVVSRPRSARAGMVTPESMLLIGFYIAASFLVFQLG
jgi:cation:H+ antiporter